MAARLTPQPAPRRAQIVAALQELGPATTEELVEHLGLNSGLVSSTIRAARLTCPGQIFRIAGYQRAVGAWQPDRAVYAAEAGPDVPKPKVDAKARRRAANKRWTAKHGAAEAAKKRAQHLRANGGTVNIWHGLAPASVRNVMTSVAANTSMAVAA